METRIMKRSKVREMQGERTALAATLDKGECCPLKPSIDMNLPTTTLVLFVVSSIIGL
jgi:hypothetical protein